MERICKTSNVWPMIWSCTVSFDLVSALLPHSIVWRSRSLSLSPLTDECDQENECDCCCTTKFHNDNHHQYILSNSHRLLANKRLDLVALMQHDLSSPLPIHYSPALKRNESSPFVSVSCRKCRSRLRLASVNVFSSWSFLVHLPTPTSPRLQSYPKQLPLSWFFK